MSSEWRPENWTGSCATCWESGLSRSTQRSSTHSAICENSNYTEHGFHKAKSGVVSKRRTIREIPKYQYQYNSDASDHAISVLKTLISSIKSGGLSRTSNILIFFSDPLQLVELVKRKKCWTTQKSCSSNSSCYNSHHRPIPTLRCTNIDDSGQQPSSSM